MKYILLALCLILPATTAAAAGKTAQQKEWSDEYQYGAKEGGADAAKHPEKTEPETAPEE